MRSTTAWIRHAGFLGLALAMLVSFGQSVQAASSKETDAGVLQAEELTRELRRKLPASMQSATARAAKLPRARAGIARDRKAALKALMARRPQDVLRLSLSAAERAALPAEDQPFLEQERVMEGELNVMIEDHRDRTEIHHILQDSRGARYALHFADHHPGLPSRSRVTVKGLALDRELVLTTMPLAAAGQTGLQVLSAPAPAATGAQQTLVILMNFQDDSSQHVQVNAARDLVFGDVNRYYGEASYGQTSITQGPSGDVVGWYTIPALSHSSCEYEQLFNQAIQAADPAVVFSAYRRVVIIFPQLAECGWWGLAYLGEVDVVTEEGVVSLGLALVNGDPALQVVAHELGHTFGLPHANSLECGTQALAEEAACTTEAYGDVFDMMGSSASGHFSAAFKERLGWLSPGHVRTIDAQGAVDVPLVPLGQPGSGAYAARIPYAINGNGEQTWYYLEYRQPGPSGGFEHYLTDYGALINGAMIRLVGTSDETRLLDMTPESVSFIDVLDAPLLPPLTFIDRGGIRIAPLTSTSTQLMVRVTIPADTLAPSARIVSPTEGEIVSGMVTIETDVTDNRSLSSVSFYRDGVLLVTDTTGPFTADWDTRTVSAGTHTLEARARDAAGNIGTSTSVTVTVQSSGQLSITISSPQEGDIFQGLRQPTAPPPSGGL